MRTKKRPAKKRPLRLRLFIGFCILIVIGIAAYYALSLPIWKIQEVAVTGTNMLSAQEVRDLSGVPISENLFFTSFARVRNNLKKITAIKYFSLYRVPPATVYIRVTERKPIAVVMLPDRSAIVDADGFILNRNPNLTLNVPNMTDLPVVSGVGRVSDVEERVNPHVSRLVADIIVELSQFLGSKHIQLEIGGFEKINLILDDILRVKLGRDEEIKRKMDVFKALLKVIEDKWAQVEYIDVRYPDNPVIKYK